jgi:hypothetical protein
MLAAVPVERGVEVHSPEVPRECAELLARYHQLHAIGKRHNSAALKLVSADALLNHGRRIRCGLAEILLLEDASLMALVFDLAIHTAEMGRSRAIDRYARSARVVPGSDDALMLGALCARNFR